MGGEGLNGLLNDGEAVVGGTVGGADIGTATDSLVVVAAGVGTAASGLNVTRSVSISSPSSSVIVSNKGSIPSAG